MDIQYTYTKYFLHKPAVVTKKCLFIGFPNNNAHIFCAFAAIMVFYKMGEKCQHKLQRSEKKLQILGILDKANHISPNRTV